MKVAKLYSSEKTKKKQLVDRQGKKSKKVVKIHRVKISELKKKLEKKRKRRDHEKKIFNFSLTRNRRKIGNVQFFNLSRHGFLYISWLQGSIYFYLDGPGVKGLVLNDTNKTISFRYFGVVDRTPVDVIPNKFKVVFDSKKDYDVIKKMIL